MDNVVQEHLEMVLELEKPFKIPDEQTARLLHAAGGLSKEAGEILDHLYRRVIYGTALDLNNMEEEAGDVLWYLELLCNAAGFTIFEAMQGNTAKLRTRYPKGFREADGITRNLEAERKAIATGKVQ